MGAANPGSPKGISRHAYYRMEPILAPRGPLILWGSSAMKLGGEARFGATERAEIRDHVVTRHNPNGHHASACRDYLPGS